MNNSSYFVLLIISIIIILVKSKNNCDFQKCGTGFNIEFKGLVKDKSSTTFGDLYNYFFSKEDVYCVGEWIMKSTNNDSDYKFVYYGDIINGIPHGVSDNTMITHTFNVENNIQNKYFYTGRWKNGYKEGNGRQQLTFIEKNGVKDIPKVITIQEGNFIKNDIVEGKEFSYVIENNVCYKYNGKFDENRPNGYGVIHHNNGTIFEGEFINGEIVKIDKNVNNKVNEFNCSEELIFFL
jgi:hypothetical protein